MYIHPGHIERVLLAMGVKSVALSRRFLEWLLMLIFLSSFNAFSSAAIVSLNFLDTVPVIPGSVPIPANPPALPSPAAPRSLVRPTLACERNTVWLRALRLGVVRTSRAFAWVPCRVGGVGRNHRRGKNAPNGLVISRQIRRPCRCRTRTNFARVAFCRVHSLEPSLGGNSYSILFPSHPACRQTTAGTQPRIRRDSDVLFENHWSGAFGGVLLFAFSIKQDR